MRRCYAQCMNYEVSSSRVAYGKCRCVHAVCGVGSALPGA
eukprot:COSAG05_NODE_25901_length_192_cov_75.279570_1_plen_39_part_01